MTGQGAARVELVEEMDRLSGVYLLQSRSSLHVFDLDTSAYLRLPGERSNTFPHDVAVLRLTHVERWPQVRGDSFFIWVDDPREYAAMDYWRQSSPISAMYRVRNASRDGTSHHPGGAHHGERPAGTAPAGGDAPVSAGAPDRADEIDLVAWPPAGGEPPQGTEELLPGLRVQLDGLWTVVTSASARLVDDGGIELVRPGVLEWPLRRDGEWETRLSIYRLAASEGMRLRLDVRHGEGAACSTSGVRLVRLVPG